MKIYLALVLRSHEIRFGLRLGYCGSLHGLGVESHENSVVLGVGGDEVRLDLV